MGGRSWPVGALLVLGGCGLLLDPEPPLPSADASIGANIDAGAIDASVPPDAVPPDADGMVGPTDGGSAACEVVAITDSAMYPAGLGGVDIAAHENRVGVVFRPAGTLGLWFVELNEALDLVETSMLNGRSGAVTATDAEWWVAAKDGLPISMWVLPFGAPPGQMEQTDSALAFALTVADHPASPGPELIYASAELYTATPRPTGGLDVRAFASPVSEPIRGLSAVWYPNAAAYFVVILTNDGISSRVRGALFDPGSGNFTTPVPIVPATVDVSLALDGVSIRTAIQNDVALVTLAVRNAVGFEGALQRIDLPGAFGPVGGSAPIFDSGDQVSAGLAVARSESGFFGLAYSDGTGAHFEVRARDGVTVVAATSIDVGEGTLYAVTEDPTDLGEFYVARKSAGGSAATVMRIACQEL